MAARDETSGLEHPLHLCQRRLGIRDVRRNVVAMGDIEKTVRERKGCHVTDVKCDVAWID